MCTRLFNNQNLDYLTTSRNMDWATSLPTSLFVFKKDLKKFPLENKEDCDWHWISEYASTVAMVGEGDHFAASDGINSEGLVANVLYANGTDYKIKRNEKTKSLSVLRWTQYVLDQFATAKEVAKAFENNQIEIIGATVPGSTKEAVLHLSVSDIKGESTVIEVYAKDKDSTPEFHIYYSGKIKRKTDIIDNTYCNVMTNEPNFGIQLKLNDYWLWQWNDNNDFPSRTIPGGPFPSDRFERATFYYNQIEEPSDMTESLSQSKSIVANASVPIGTQGFKDHPNIAPTIWSTISNHNDQIYYFGNARTPNIINIKMNESMPKFDVLTLEVVRVIVKEGVVDGEIKPVIDEVIDYSYEGCVNDALTPAEDPFK